ncbi:transporter [filamentous cyanobacterium LEGE 11480]|uniref:Transporter n=2 Tax=Romeriopsis TaxID=2992131 RepID=A0A928Z3P5_9CYAN|nr:transporter [Romeriopsis navalis LEGE 11480]
MLLPADAARFVQPVDVPEAVLLAARSITPIVNSKTLPLSPSALSASPFLIADGNPAEAAKLNLWTSARPDGHAPIGVMGDHTHKKGEWMFSYRYMFMEMDGNRDGTNSLSTADVLQQFPVSPLRMTMHMHMLGAMYAPSDNVTLMGMLPFVIKEMDHVTRRGTQFTTKSSGIGDIKLGGLIKIYDQNRQRIHLNAGFTVPTGSINERATTPAGPNSVLPYPMQIGSGTFDLTPGITYLGEADSFSWGAQAMGVLRLGRNSNSYRLGNQFELTGWGAYKWSDVVSTSLRLKGKTWGDIDGADPRLNPNLIPTANPELRSGTTIDLGLGLNLYAPNGPLQGSRIGIEFALPLLRDLDGPQLETDWTLTLGVQTSF